MSNKKLIIICVLIIFILMNVTGCSWSKSPSKEVAKAMQPFTLKYWRVWDGPDDFQEMINNFQAQYPYITIDYRKLSYAEYERELEWAFATDQAPDLFSIHNTWMLRYNNAGFISPLPENITMAHEYITGSIKKEKVAELITTKSITPAKLREDFIDAVPKDVIINAKDQKTNTMLEKIFGLPLSVDTMVMYYNKDLFNAAGIINPPKLWNKEFQQNVKSLTKQSKLGNIERSGVSLGGSVNIDRSSDILSLLMMQTGTTMLENGAVMFNQPSKNGQSTGADALRFYTDFARPNTEVYCWNNTLPNSLEMFKQGNLGMLFGYAYMRPDIASTEKLNYAIAPMLQLEGSVSQTNFANYWVEVVSAKSQHKDAAWSFIQFMTTNPDQDKIYLSKTKYPAALRSLIAEQKEDPEMSVFANQLLTSKSWYKGNNANAMEKIFNEMIAEATNNPEKIENIINQGAVKVQQTINEPLKL